MVLLSVMVPGGALLCAAPVSTGGLDRFLNNLPYMLGGSISMMSLMIAGFLARRYWTICLFFYMGVVLLLGYGVDLIFAAASLAGAFPIRDPEVRVVGLVGLIELVVFAPAPWFLLRALRLRYWQPGSTPDQWEPGDETPPKWALSPSRRKER